VICSQPAMVARSASERRRDGVEEFHAGESPDAGFYARQTVHNFPARSRPVECGSPNPPPGG
jgi:hypothetical protein